jgi:hypothetical protein
MKAGKVFNISYATYHSYFQMAVSVTDYRGYFRIYALRVVTGLDNIEPRRSRGPKFYGFGVWVSGISEGSCA